MEWWIVLLFCIGAAASQAAVCFSNKPVVSVVVLILHALALVALALLGAELRQIFIFLLFSVVCCLLAFKIKKGRKAE